ncbi:MAG: putative toxin-antitoxin system toxin component, PIN family [Firmicutes bacterium]|nr:putative toxin-antitoxin system toxin component, PIN family [Bacillota bacterium]
MKVMLDTNVLFSALIHGGKVAPIVVEYISKHYDLYLLDYVIEELKKITHKKKPHKLDELDELLAKLNYTLLETPERNFDDYPDMRDSKDVPILRAAFTYKMDVLITGDKDFDDVIVLEKPKIMNLADFADKYVKGVRWFQ